MKCPKCGNNLKSRDKFCNECGTKVEGEFNTSKYQMIYKDFKRYLSGNKSLKISATILFMSVIWVCIISIFGCFFKDRTLIKENNENDLSYYEETYTENSVTESPTEEITEYTEPITTEPVTTEPVTTEPPTEKPTDITDTMTMLYDDSNVSVYYCNVEQSYYGDEVDVQLFINNKTDKSIVFYSDTVVLDGISYNDVFCADQISANTRGMIGISVNDCSNIAPSLVGADLRYKYADRSRDSVDLYITSQSVK